MHRLLFTILLSGSLALPMTAVASEQDKPLSEVLSASEGKSLTSKLEKYLGAGVDSKDLVGMRDKFEKEVNKLESKHKVGLLRDIEYLGGLFTLASTHSHERPKSKGRAKEYTKTELIAGNKLEASYTLFVPKGYRGDKPWPIIIGLHPAGKDGNWYMEEVLDDPALRESYIILCPTIAEGESWTERAGIIKMIGLSLNEVATKHFVDKDRMFLDGFADSGNAALKLASSFEDLFAGVVSRSGGLDGVPVETNMSYVGAFCAVGTDDQALKLDDLRKQVDGLAQKKIPITLKEMAGAGQSTFTELNGEIAAWLAERKRQLFPQTVSISTEHPMFGRAFWVAVLRTETGIDPETKAPFVATLQASYDRGENRIDITSKNVYKIEVFLNDTIVDMDRPITIRVNGEEKWQGIKERDWRYLIDRYRSSGDPTRLFTASIDIDIR